MHLTRDPWIPCLDANRNLKRVSVAELADSRLRSLATHRPDFTGALAQVLIALLTVALKPRDEDEWYDLYHKPPDPVQLGAALEPWHSAFVLSSDGGPAFFQDLSQLDAENIWSIDKLLIDRGSDVNLHFNHPFERPGFCPTCTALALATLQLNAPPGGSGHRVSVRGGGPLTTLLLPDDQEATLWDRLWLNAIPLQSLSIRDAFQPENVIPWLSQTRRSDGPTGQETYPRDVHPLQVLWSFSRRIRLVNSDHTAGTCTLCGTTTPQRFHSFRIRHGGTNYAGPWIHPYTPYLYDPKGGDPTSIKGGWGRHAWRRWVALALRRPSQDTTGPTSAAIVQLHPTRRTRPRVRLWCFGYEMDNAKARGWYESVLPVHEVPDDQLATLRQRLLTVVEQAGSALSALNKAVRSARFAAATKNAGPWQPVVDAFWNATESPYYTLLGALTGSGDDEDSVAAAIETWHRELRLRTLRIFDSYALSVPLDGHNAEALVTARATLEIALRAGQKSRRPRKASQSGDKT